MWFKKKAYISGYNSSTAVDGTDWRTDGNQQSWPISQTLPSAADANKYFYLPALGNYPSGKLSGVGAGGFYWSSSASPLASFLGNYLYFNMFIVGVSSNSRYYGMRVDGFE